MVMKPTPKHDRERETVAKWLSRNIKIHPEDWRDLGRSERNFYRGAAEEIMGILDDLRAAIK